MFASRWMQPNCHRLAERLNVAAHIAVDAPQAGVDPSVIALWLGHESVETTQIYLDANLALKEKILSKTHPLGGKSYRFRAEDQLLVFLKSL